MSPELQVGGTEIFVDGIQVGVVSQKHLVGGSVLQHLGNRSQVSALLSGQLTPRRHLNDVEGVRGHDGRVHVAVIQQVPHDLKGKITSLGSLNPSCFLFYKDAYIKKTNVKLGQLI